MEPKPDTPPTPGTYHAAVVVGQVGDFGSARSAIREGYHWAEQDPPDRALASKYSNDLSKVRFLWEFLHARSCTDGHNSDRLRVGHIMRCGR